MRKNIVNVLIVTFVIALVLPITVLGQITPTEKTPTTSLSAPTEQQRFIVQLVDPPVLENQNLLSTHGSTDIRSFQTQQYINSLQEQQVRTFSSIQRRIPEAQIASYTDENKSARELTYQIAFNGFTITLPNNSPGTIKEIMADPNVLFVFPEVEYQLDMDASLPLIGLGDPTTDAVFADGMWDLLGGVEHAGEGMKVAVLDTGIDINHDFFDPTGFSYPTGYPLGETDYTTPKVIVARSYFRADDPPQHDDPLDHNGHGSHTSGTIAGNYGTVATVGTLTQTVSGIAPMAQLMNYQIFYLAESGSQSAWNPEILMALEDLILDGADVTNNSWGGAEAFLPEMDPVGIAFQNIIDSGIVAVKSAGNQGRGAGSVDTLSGLEDLISVGATTTTRSFGNSLDVTAPTPGSIPITLTNILATEADVTPAITETVGPETYVYVDRVDSGNGEACNAIGADLTGYIALISRGSCAFTDKITNAYNAGAAGVVVFNNILGAPPIVMGGDPAPDIPAFMIGNGAGLDLVAWDAAHPGEAELQINTTTSRIANAKSADIIADFSGTGPNNSIGIGPHIVAPGVDILSASYDNEWMVIQGTSMSAPHVTGAAVLLRQLHPDWTVGEIKSALMTKAETDDLYNDYPQTDEAGAMDRGAGRLDLSDMGDVDLFIAPQALSFRTISVTDTVTAEIRVWAGMAEDTYSITVEELVTDTDSLTVTVDMSSIDAPTSGDAAFEITIETLNAAPGDYEGWIWFEDGSGEMYHMPYWVRVIPESDATVLLLDDDFSIDPNLGDVLGFYTNTLTAMGLDYDIWDVGLNGYYSPGTTGGLPPVSTLQQYNTIIWFTGESYYSYYNLGAKVDDRWAFLDYLNSTDAKVIVSGQDFSGYMSSGDSDAPLLAHTGFSTDIAKWDAFNPHSVSSPYEAAMGIPTDLAFGDMVFDLGYNPPFTTTSETYVDELSPDTDYGGAGFIQSLMPGASADGFVAIKRAFEPTLENAGVQDINDYRSLYFSFGLENIVNTTGYTTSLELMETAMDWLHDKPSTELVTNKIQYLRNEDVFITATLTSTIESVVGHYYKWDFGDSTPIITTTQNTTIHQYTGTGNFLLQLEVTDSLGHKTLSQQQLSIIGPPEFLSSDHISFNIGEQENFTIETTGLPTPTISLTSGILPADITFTDNGNGTAALAGIPQTETGWDYPLVIRAANGLSPDATQTLVLTVNEAPLIISSNTYSLTVGTEGTFVITSTGWPTATISSDGELPAGINLIDNGDGTAAITGTPLVNSGGEYTLTITAENGVQPNAYQNFTLTVYEAPQINSTNTTTMIEGTAGSFDITAIGWPTAIISLTGELPDGLSFTDNSDSTATIQGTPIAGSNGEYEFTITASNNILPIDTQEFLLTISEPYEILTIAPGNSSTTSDGVLDFEIPGSAATPVSITYTPLLTPTNSTGTFQFAGTTFQLQAEDSNGNPIIQPSPAYTLSLHYDESLLPSGADEIDLNLYRYDEIEGNWVLLNVLSRDITANIIILQLDHFSEFALFIVDADIDEPKIYLPFIKGN